MKKTVNLEEFAMSKIRTHYDNLKVARNAPDAVIKAAHKALLQLHHPDKAADKTQAERITRIINEAREVLLDPERRKQHDEWIKEKERPHHQHGHGRDHARDFEAAQPEKKGPGVERQAIGKYVAATDGTAIDTETGLMWCRFALGQTWRLDSVSEHAKIFTWQAALDAAKEFNRQGGFAGHRDWRVPSINELKTLLDGNSGNKNSAIHFIDNRVFPENPPWVWSSTPYAGYGGGAWFVHFKGGEAINEDAGLARAVRLVRDHKAA